MSGYRIIPASILHVRPISKRLRTGSAVALEQFGFNPREGLRRALNGSFYARTAIAEDGRPLAMWGLCGSMLGDAAYVWLALTSEVITMPRAILKEARRELEEQSMRVDRISATLIPGDEDAVRLARHLGFDPDRVDRVRVGDNDLISLDYHPEAAA